MPGWEEMDHLYPEKSGLAGITCRPRVHADPHRTLAPIMTPGSSLPSPRQNIANPMPSHAIPRPLLSEVCRPSAPCRTQIRIWVDILASRWMPRTAQYVRYSRLSHLFLVWDHRPHRRGITSPDRQMRMLRRCLRGSSRREISARQRSCQLSRLGRPCLPRHQLLLGRYLICLPR